MNKKILILAHSCEGTTGVDDELWQYLKDRDYREVVLVKFPFLNSKNGSVKTQILKDGRQFQKESSIRFYRPEPLSYLKDWLYAVYYGLRFGRGSDLILCTTNLITTAGLLLRRLGVGRRVGYIMIDYTPVRYKNPLLNRLYYWLDRRACYGADAVLPFDPAMTRGRAEDGQLDLKKIKKTIVSPFGNNSELYQSADYESFDPKKIVYFGGVLKNKGADLFVPIVQSLIKHGLKDFHFECIGGGDLDFLREQIAAAKLASYFTVHGRVQDHHEVERMLMGCGLAIAPYYPEDKNNFSYYADAAKVKVYLGCGLPVVITAVPPVAKALVARDAGVIAEYDADDFARQIIKIMKDTKAYAKYRRNAIEFGREFAWPKIFDRVLKELGD